MPKRDTFATPTKSRVKVIPHFHTPQKTSSPAKPETPIDVDELGPTPQLNGRVLGLFEVITSPQKTPQSNTVQVTENITLTPAKKNLDFSKLKEEESSPEFKTPQKPIVTQQQTPLYLRPGGFKEITASPSPLLTQRIKKGLSTIISEFRDIQAELKYGDFDDEDIVPLENTDGEEEIEEEEADVPRKKKKTQKRTTRRYVIKARPSTETSTMEGKDIKNEMKKLEEKHKDEEVESDEYEEWSDGPEEFIPRPRQEPSTSSKGKKKGGESQNFKRLKLRDGRSKRNFGKRSRGW